jgi:hypothetical protein
MISWMIERMDYRRGPACEPAHTATSLHEKRTVDQLSAA